VTRFLAVFFCLGEFLTQQSHDSCLVDFVLSWRLSPTHTRSAVTRVLATFSHTLSLLPLSLARARVRARVLAGERALKKGTNRQDAIYSTRTCTFSRTTCSLFAVHALF